MQKISNPACSFPMNPAEDLFVDNAEGYHIRGGMRWAEGRIQDAISDFKIGKQKNPEYAYNYWALGNIYLSTDKSLSLSELEKAAELFLKQRNEPMVEAVQWEIKRIRASV